MDRASERKLLQQVLRQSEHGAPRLLTSHLFLPLVWLVLVLLFLGAFRFAGAAGAMGILALALAAMAGALGVGAYFLALWAKQWPVVGRHVEEQSIRRRLEELET